jgi:hypothetical protein
MSYFLRGQGHVALLLVRRAGPHQKVWSPTPGILRKTHYCRYPAERPDNIHTTDGRGRVVNPRASGNGWLPLAGSGRARSVRDDGAIARVGWVAGAISLTSTRNAPSARVGGPALGPASSIARRGRSWMRRGGRRHAAATSDPRLRGSLWSRMCFHAQPPVVPGCCTDPVPDADGATATTVYHLSEIAGTLGFSEAPAVSARLHQPSAKRS